MKKSVQMLAGIAALHCLALMQSCRDKCGDQGRSTYFDVTGINAQHQYNPQEDSVQTETYKLYLTAQASYYGLQPLQSNWGNTAFATDCFTIPPGVLGSQEKIKRLVVTSDAAWDSLHAAGADLSDLMYAQGSNNSSAPGWEVMRLNSIIHHQPQATQAIELRFVQPPPMGRRHAFKVEYEQTNGEKYTATLSPLTFK